MNSAALAVGANIHPGSPACTKHAPLKSRAGPSPAGRIPKITMEPKLTASHAEAFLLDFHDRRPGTTSAGFGNMPAFRSDKRFASSYSCLVDVVPSGDTPLHVLDLGCGDGHLLQELARRSQSGLRLTGIDMSPGELAIAGERLGNAAALRCERAQSLSAHTGSVDIVVSHLALMLMDDLNDVLKEVSRVLKPDGIFAAIVGAENIVSPVVQLWIRLLKPLLAEQKTSMPRLGDARARSREGLLSALGPFFTDISTDKPLPTFP